MITLTQAFRLLNIEDCEIVYLKAGVSKRIHGYSGRKIREKLDMKNLRVSGIGLNFGYTTEFQGYILTIQGISENDLWRKLGWF